MKRERILKRRCLKGAIYSESLLALRIILEKILADELNWVFGTFFGHF